MRCGGAYARPKSNNSLNQKYASAKASVNYATFRKKRIAVPAIADAICWRRPLKVSLPAGRSHLRMHLPDTGVPVTPVQASSKEASRSVPVVVALSGVALDMLAGSLAS